MSTILSHIQFAVEGQGLEPCVTCGDPDVADGDVVCIHCWDCCPRFNAFIRCELRVRIAWVGFYLSLYGEVRPFPGDRPVTLRTPTSRGQGVFDQLHQVALAEFAGRYTKLKPTGPGRWKGLCPIHHEKTPSFYIYSEPWRWYCFGACAGGGDIVDLARELQAGLPGMGHRRRRIPAFEVTL